jgi:hypothetical protein
MSAHTLVDNWEKGAGGNPVLCGSGIYGLPIKCAADGTQCQFIRVTFDSFGEVSSVRGNILSFEEYCLLATKVITDNAISEKLCDVAMFFRLAKGVWNWETGF